MELTKSIRGDFEAYRNTKKIPTQKEVRNMLLFSKRLRRWTWT